ncbi:glycosyltransferase family 2 protein [Marixanthomonas spongiae]|uniref:Glycosyltransferase 2-like domain-containing protein n=1 Tax=Marixanthomonas spongiae TaxID=2174845 RepID=A0A2U0I5T9_9FLAO|nr:glycosyltransferase family 2 protein [Marixanthomonas spongiae]PVW16473.1 hypothetical protein DDV96_04250 [Marixanthomonas spongiae]
MNGNKQHIGIVIPYYNASVQIEAVVQKALQYSDHIVIVDDASPEPLPHSLDSHNDTVTILKLPENLGVGGATKKGFAHFETVPAMEVVVKLDADDQMDTEYIPHLVAPVLAGTHDFVKGNRFRDFEALKSMPWPRRFGNLFLSFLSKVATGYWNCFDFNNGFFAISTKSLQLMDKNPIANNYFFETSLIAELYHQKAKIKELAMPAIYGNEKSNMKLFKMPWLFGVNLLKKLVSRIWKAYFVYDFNIGTLYIIFGHLLFLGGAVYGGINWYHYANQGIPTPVGTIMISALLVILGFQLLLQAVQFDVFKTPDRD